MSLLRADARHIPLADGCVQCVVTSPPYWGLRDYGTARWEGGDAACDHKAPNAAQRYFNGQGAVYERGGAPSARRNESNYRYVCGKCGAHRIDRQIGLEQTPDSYVAELVAMFREVRRVLRDDGVLWLNLGSTYFGGGQGGAGSFASERPGWQQPDVSGASGRIPSRRGQRAPAYGTDGTALPDSMAADSAYSGLCDGCLADFRSHRDHIAGSVQPTEQSAPLPSPIGRDSGPPDCVEAFPTASLPDVLASTTIESWRRHQGACSRCDARSSDLSAVHSFAADAPEFSRMTLGNYTGRLKQKDLVPVPWMVAFALQADGWYLRSDIIWHKPNPMPESVTDRPTKAHEYVFLLTKRERYFYDAKAIQETSIVSAGRTMRFGSPKQEGTLRKDIGRARTDDGTRNARTVWTIATQPYSGASGAHFATFPAALVERCVLAGSKPGDRVLDPFGGSGTTARVALSLGRKAVSTELNPAYLALAKERTHVTLGLPLEVA
jgi:DNA modification methylase